MGRPKKKETIESKMKDIIGQAIEEKRFMLARQLLDVLNMEVSPSEYQPLELPAEEPNANDSI